MLTRHTFGLSWPSTIYGAWLVLRANQLWAPYPNNDPDGARRAMERFYRMVAERHDDTFDPRRASELEVEWWRVHREHQHDGSAVGDEAPLIAALSALYSYVYGVSEADVAVAAEQRALAMRHSDQWVREGSAPASPCAARSAAGSVPERPRAAAAPGAAGQPRLEDSLRSSDLVVRLGGDEFALALLDGDADYAATAGRLAARIEEPYVVDAVGSSRREHRAALRSRAGVHHLEAQAGRRARAARALPAARPPARRAAWPRGLDTSTARRAITGRHHWPSCSSPRPSTTASTPVMWSPGCCSCISSETNSASPARTGAATPLTAACAWC